MAIGSLGFYTESYGNMTRTVARHITEMREQNGQKCGESDTEPKAGVLDGVSNIRFDFGPRVVVTEPVASQTV